MKSSSMLTLAAMLSMLLFAACQKPPEPASPTSPDPKAAAAPADPGPGSTTNFENPAPAEPAKQ